MNYTIWPIKFDRKRRTHCGQRLSVMGDCPERAEYLIRFVSSSNREPADLVFCREHTMKSVDAALSLMASSYWTNDEEVIR